MFTESLNVSKMSMLYYNGLCGSVLTVDTTNANVQVVSHLKDCSSLIIHYPVTPVPLCVLLWLRIPLQISDQVVRVVETMYVMFCQC